MKLANRLSYLAGRSLFRRSSGRYCELDRREFLESMGKGALAAAVASLAVVGVPLTGCGSSNSGSNDSRSGQESTWESEQERIRRSILSYLAQPHVVSPDFLEKLTGSRATMELYMVDEDMVYFSVPTSQFDRRETLSSLTEKPESAEIGQQQGNGLFFSKIYFAKPASTLFRFPAKDFKVKADEVIHFDFRRVQYTTTAKELADFIENKSVYGGPLGAAEGIDEYGNYQVIVNHGVVVAKRGEPSMKRLVAKIVNKTSRTETVAQRLLDFVTGEIEYDGKGVISGIEFLKRPNEVLMTKIADCSGKVVLYASLLEQTKIDYRLLYMPESNGEESHITVGIAGGFQRTNGLDLKCRGKRYFVAETTTEGFQIGETYLENIFVKDIKYAQKPGRNSRIYDIRTGRPLKFV